MFEFSDDSLNEKIKRKPKNQNSKNERESSENKFIQSDAEKEEKIEKEEIVFFEDEPKENEQKAEKEG